MLSIQVRMTGSGVRLRGGNFSLFQCHAKDHRVLDHEFAHVCCKPHQSLLCISTRIVHWHDLFFLAQHIRKCLILNPLNPLPRFCKCILYNTTVNILEVPSVVSE